MPLPTLQGLRHLLSMSQSLSNILIHTIFSTKNRAPFLRKMTMREETFAYLGGTAKTLGCQPIIIGGFEDHVHLLTTLSRTVSVSDFVKETKRISSRWAKEEKGMPDFGWQSGYGVFSVSESMVPKVREYIETQAEHHQAVSFQEEYRSFLERHQIPYDERFVWD